MAVQIYLIRHGQTPNNITGERLYNEGLTELGRVQALRLARALAPEGLTAVVCSPLLRAMETAVPIAAAAGVPLEASNDLVEFNRWDAYVGASREHLANRFPGVRLEPAMPSGGWPYPGPEPHPECRRRVERVLARVAALPAGSAMALVAHGTFNGWLLAAWLGLDPAGVTFSQDNGCINSLRLEDGRVTVRRLNDTRHLDGVASPPT